MPLIGVLSLTAIKDAYDDFQRYISDSQVNNRISKCLRNGKLMNEKWSDVQVSYFDKKKHTQSVNKSRTNDLFIDQFQFHFHFHFDCKHILFLILFRSVT